MVAEQLEAAFTNVAPSPENNNKTWNKTGIILDWNCM